MAKSNPQLSAIDEKIIEEAWKKMNPSIFLNDYVKNSDGGFHAPTLGHGSIAYAYPKCSLKNASCAGIQA